MKRKALYFHSFIHLLNKKYIHEVETGIYPVPVSSHRLYLLYEKGNGMNREKTLNFSLDANQHKHTGASKTLMVHVWIVLKNYGKKGAIKCP